MKAWEEYEATVKTVVADLGEQLNVAYAEGKQTIFTDTGSSFEIDAKAWCKDGDGYLIVEAKRHNRAGPSKDVVASLGYKIIKLRQPVA
jgi:hypothetical protein